MTGFVVFAHGSRIDAANEAVRAVSAGMAETLAATGDAIIETAFLELGTPDLPAAVERLMERGADRVVVIPYFLTLGRHVERDLPAIVREISNRHNGISIEITPPLDGHPALLQVMLERARGALG
jgi:sirohydrochlorin ferrochelatase